MAKDKKKLKGKVKVQKRPLRERFFKNLVHEDAKSIGDYIIDDLLVPTINATILRVITGTAEKLFGNGSGGVSNTVRTNASYINYNSISQKPNATVSGNRYNMKKFVFSDRSDADDVKDQICALIESQYQAASVGDLYDLVNETPEPTDWNYGWKSTKGISVKYTADGYILDMPNPRPLR